MTDFDAKRSTDDDRELVAALKESRDDVSTRASRAHALTDREASDVAADRRATVVVLAGGVASGKTTLIASLYERFGHGPIAGRMFAGSLTLPGFEARAQGLRPTQGVRRLMPHTHRNAVPWLHLRVVAASGLPQELLLGDFDGEVFDRVIEGKDPAQSVPALRRADHVSIVLDGHGLVDATKRSLVRQRAIDLIDVLTKAGVVASPRVFSIVLTKLDLVDGAPNDDRESARSIVAELRDRLSSRAQLSSPPVIETAAISSAPSLPLGHGVDDLLDLWHRSPATDIDRPQEADEPTTAREWFGRFG